MTSSDETAPAEPANKADDWRISFEQIARENRSLRWQVRSLALVLGLFVLVAARQPPEVLDELRTKKLVVVDSTGAQRIVLDAPKHDDSKGIMALIQVYNEKGKPALAIGADAFRSNAFAVFRDAGGVDRALLLAGDNEGMTRLKLRDARSRDRVQLYSNEEEWCGLQVIPRKGNMKVVTTN